MSTGREACSGISTGSVLGRVLFNIFTNDSDESIEEIFVEHMDESKLRGAARTSENRLKIHKDLERLECGVLLHKMFRGEKCKVLHLGKKKLVHRYKIDGTWLTSDTWKKVRVFW